MVMTMITIDQKIAEKLNDWAPSGWPVGNLILVIIALFLSIILCGAIGIEREWHGRSAGLRTHLLVGVGSCILMIISIYGFPAVLSGDKRDAARIAAQVVTGVGFLGAGAIVHKRSGGIQGLTTAATIWIVMAIGLACGSFNFILALIGTISILVVLTLFKKIEVKLNKHNPTIVITAPSEITLLDNILTISEKYDCTVQSINSEMIGSAENRLIQLTFQVIFNSGEDRLNDYVGELGKATNATSIKLLSHH